MVFLFNSCNLSLQCNEKSSYTTTPYRKQSIGIFCFNIVITGGQAWKIMTKKLRINGATTLLPKREEREREREKGCHMTLLTFWKILHGLRGL